MVNIFELLNNKTNSKVLQYFLDNPTKQAYAAQIIKEIRMAKGGVLTALQKIEASGIIDSKQIGRMKLYFLIRDSPVCKQLKILSSLSSLAELGKELRKLSPEGEFYIFGSVARGENTEKSDADILIIAPEGPGAFSALLARHWKTGDIKPIIRNRMDYALMKKSDPAFYERMEKDKIRLV